MTFEESVSDGHRTLGTIKGLNSGFRVILDVAGMFDTKGTLADARRFLLDADKMVRDLNARNEQCRADYEALLERHEAAMEGHGPAVSPGALEAARKRAEAAEEVVRLLSRDHSEQVWREHIAAMSAKWEAMKAEGDAA